MGIHLLPLLSAIVYVIGALFLKRGADLGAGTWGTVWVCNLVAAIGFSPLLLLGGGPPIGLPYWQPAVVGMLFIAGQVFTFRSLQIGDVSIATPILGVKIVLVAVLTALLLRERVAPAVWTAAMLSTAAVALLNANWGGRHRRVSSTIAMAGLGAICYALFDVLVQRWASAWGIGRFLPLMMGFVAMFSLPWWWLRQPAPAASKRWILAGAICLAVQSVMFVSTIALFGQAAVANVLYSSRGLWSVLAVWFIGRWFHNREHLLGGRVLAGRLVGAALLMTAILLVLLAPRT
ncbi:MAG: DMT family transporter [Verrucomicrobiota bacterium]